MPADARRRRSPAAQLGLNRSRIVPEYSFLDARGLGALDGISEADAAQKLAAGDLRDVNWRPPHGAPQSITHLLHHHDHKHHSHSHRTSHTAHSAHTTTQVRTARPTRA
jgi:hypothetical protein